MSRLVNPTEDNDHDFQNNRSGTSDYRTDDRRGIRSNGDRQQGGRCHAGATMHRDGEWRASKLVGVNVYNQANEKIGDINDVILDKSGKASKVIIGVGGFLGMGEHNVAVPFEKLKWVNEPVRSQHVNSAGQRARDQCGQQCPYSRGRHRKNDDRYRDHYPYHYATDPRRQPKLVSRSCGVQCDQGPVKGDAGVQVLIG